MVTRFYFSTLVPPVSPTFDASWEATGVPTRRVLEHEKSYLTAYENIGVATALNSPAGAVDVAIAQYTSAPLSGAQTISGTIKGQIRAVESATAADLRAQIVVWVRTSAGGVRGTLLASDASALASEWPITTGQNRKFPIGSPATPTSVAAQDGDRIVVEVGYRKHENATTSRTGTIGLGGVSTDSDFAEDETDTSSTKNAWIEFADTLTFQATAQRTSAVPVEVVYSPTDQTARVTSIVGEVVYAPTDQTARITSLVVEVVYPSNLPAAGGARFRAQIIG